MSMTDVAPNSNRSGFYRSFIAGLHNILISIKRHIRLFIFCLLTPVAIFVVYYFAGANKYESSFTVVYEELTRKVYGDRLEKLNILAKREDYQNLRYLLGIKPEIAKTIILA